jgi:molecular chaperone HtpG
LNDKKLNISIESLPVDELPVTITLNEFMRRMKDMSHNGGGGMMMFGDFPMNYNVAVNANHPLTQKILSADQPETQKQLVRHVYDLALLSQNMLLGAELTNFIQRTVELTK